MYCSGLGALYSGAGVWPLLMPRSSPQFPPTAVDHARQTPPREGDNPFLSCVPVDTVLIRIVFVKPL